MGPQENETFACHHCGAEADLTLEGFEGVKEVVERHAKLICKTCGGEISIESPKEKTLACEHCGAEADISIEGFEGVQDVVNRERSMTCKSCGHEIPWTERADINAVRMAMEAENEAQQFYARAAEQTKNPRGRDMFQQLSEFEMNHYQKLKELLHSLTEKGEWLLYSGTRLRTSGAPRKGETPKGQDRLSDMDALKLAVKEEKKAQAYYRSLAEATKDARGRDMYKRLADEEALHEKILNDQYYSLHNTGIWSWGD